MEELITTPSAATIAAPAPATTGFFSGFTGGVLTGIGSAIAAYSVYRLTRWAVRHWRTTSAAAPAQAAPAAPAATPATSAPAAPEAPIQ